MKNLRAKIAAEAIDWLTTPYHHHARIKRVGVDCAQILCAVYEEVGLVPHIETGFYPVDWHLHRGEEIYQRWLADSGARRLPLEEEPDIGDIAIYKFGRTYSHAGILVERELVVHAYVGRGVILSRMSEDPLCERPVQYWSLF